MPKQDIRWLQQNRLRLTEQGRVMKEDWLARWQEGRIGWHEPAGNAALHEFWPVLPAGSRVLLPLCGKSRDIRWLADRGHEVTGVEMSGIAIAAFFAEQRLEFRRVSGRLERYQASNANISLVCGDFFEFDDAPFDAVFDRGALVAIPPDGRPQYAAHVDRLLLDDAFRLIVTLEYDQTRVAGPPFAVWRDELLGYWPKLLRVAEHDDLENCPPKFREAGLRDVVEAVWSAPRAR